MTDSPDNPDAGDDARVAPDHRATPGTSRWQRVVGIIGLLVILWVGNRMLGTFLGRGPGPGGHGPGQEGPPAEMQEHGIEGGGGHVPPPGLR